MSTSARVDKSPSPDLLSSADVSQGSPVVIPQTDIHSEGTLRQLRNKYACRKNTKKSVKLQVLINHPTLDKYNGKHAP